MLQIQPSSTSECNLFGNIHTKARNRLTNTRLEKWVAIQANFRLFEPDNEPSSTVKMRPQSLMFKRWTLRRSREKTWKPTWVFIDYCYITQRQTQLVRSSVFPGYCSAHIQSSHWTHLKMLSGTHSSKGGTSKTKSVLHSCTLFSHCLCFASFPHPEAKGSTKDLLSALHDPLEPKVYLKHLVNLVVIYC